jgi:hypothetical protein
MNTTINPLPIPIYKDKKGIEAEIILGNPKMECRKFGICAINPYGISSTIFSPSPRKAIAQIYLLQNHIVIRFLIDSMTDGTRKSFFETPFNGFRIVSPVILPSFIFPLPISFISQIPSGTFSIYKTKQYYKVICPIKISNNEESSEKKNTQICRS